MSCSVVTPLHMGGFGRTVKFYFVKYCWLGFSIRYHYFSCLWQVFLPKNTRQRRANTGCGLQVLTSNLELNSPGRFMGSQLSCASSVSFEYFEARKMFKRTLRQHGSVLFCKCRASIPQKETLPRHRSSIKAF